MVTPDWLGTGAPPRGRGGLGWWWAAAAGDEAAAVDEAVMPKAGAKGAALLEKPWLLRGACWALPKTLATICEGVIPTTGTLGA
eukprot:g24823.t1